jgi:hypothetical protein
MSNEEPETISQDIPNGDIVYHITSEETAEIADIYAGDHYVAQLTKQGDMIVEYKPGWEDDAVMQFQWGKMASLACISSVPMGIDEEGKLILPDGWTTAEIWDKWQNIDDAIVGVEFNHVSSTLETINSLQQIKVIRGDYPYQVIGITDQGTFFDGGVMEVMDDPDLTDEKEKIERLVQLEDVNMSAGGFCIAALDQSGTVVGIHLLEEQYDHIKKIAANKLNIYALTEEGTIICLTTNQDPWVCESKWIDMAVGETEKGEDILLGLTEEGTLISNQGECYEGIFNVEKMVVSYDGTYKILYEDGSVATY